MRDRSNLILSVCILVLVTSASVSANFSERQKITSTPRGAGAQYGYSVAIDGSTMVVGARHDGTTASQAGAAFVYVRSGSTWTQQAILLASDGNTSDEFGAAVAINGDTIVVGAYRDDAAFANSGSAYVFVRSGTTWTQQQKLTANDATAEDEFGNAVAIYIDDIIVGAHHADLPNNAEAGSAYTFNRSGTVWSQLERLVPVQSTTAPVLGDHFGESTALSEETLVIGAPGDDFPETAAGAVYVFLNVGGTYVPHQKITIASGTNGDNFGGTVAVDGGVLVGGAREDSVTVGQPSFGAAYVFEVTGGVWQPQGKLTASDGAAFDRFGWSVAVSDGVIAVGARGDATAAGPDAGSAYVFNRNVNDWIETQKLGPIDAFNGDRFGASAALRGGDLIIGAAEKSLSNPNGQGAVYYFTLPRAAVPFDYDGDLKTDISIFRPANGQWWLQNSGDNVVRAFQFGISTDRPVPADYDGDGKVDIAVFRPASGDWYILRSSDSTFYGLPFGVGTDHPTPGDFDADGLADIAVFRQTEGVWYINRSTGGFQITQWGTSGDIPVNSDYDGDGRSDTAIFRPSNGQWWLNRTTAGITATTFGVGGDKAVPADYTGDGQTDIAVFRPNNGSWYILRSEDSSFFAVPFGANGDIPVAGDYDGDGKADVGVFRPDGSVWFVQQSGSGILILPFGTAGDIPTPSAYVR